MLTALTQPDSVASLTHAFRLSNMTEIITNASNISVRGIMVILERLQFIVSAELQLPCCIRPDTADYLDHIEVYG